VPSIILSRTNGTCTSYIAWWPRAVSVRRWRCQDSVDGEELPDDIF